MKHYLEAVEIIDSLDGLGDFIRADITDKTLAEVIAIQTAIDDVMNGTHYQLKRHICGYEDNKPCIIELIKEVL